jgi:hypothetical protein
MLYLGLKPDAKFGCTRCGWRGLRRHILETDHPFIFNHRMYGCPQCGHDNELRPLCLHEKCLELYTHSVNSQLLCDEHYNELPYDFY